MANKQFNDSVFSRVFNKNEFFIENWSLNVFNKLKNQKTIPFYIKRWKSNFKSDLLYSAGSSYSESNLFTNGNSLSIDSVSTLTLEREIKLGKNFEISFEADFSDIGTGFILNIGNLIDITYNGTDLIFDITEASYITQDIEGVRKIKLVRNHTNYTLSVDGTDTVYQSNSNVETIESGVFINIVPEGDLKLSNIKILSLDSSKIYHWWKLNCDNEARFLDIGNNSYDFFTFFYTIIRLASYIVRFSKYFRVDELDESFVRRFLDSRNVFYRDDISYQNLLVRFFNWKNILKERATQSIIKKIDQVKNYSFGGDAGSTYSISSEIKQEQNLGGDYILSFETKLTDGMNVLDILDCFTISKAGDNVTVNFSITGGGQTLSFNKVFVLEDGNYDFKLIKTGITANFYINNEIQDVTFTLPNVPTEPDFKFKQIFSDFEQSNFISYISVDYFVSGVKKTIKYLFDDIDTLFINTVDRNPIFEARIFGLSSILNINKYFKSNQFDTPSNNNYKEYNGELIEIYEKTDETEIELAKASINDLAWTLGRTSPLNKQTYPIQGFNKLPNKSRDIKVLGDYPIRMTGTDIAFSGIFYNDGKIKVEEMPTTIEDFIKSEIDSVNNKTYLNRFIQQCDPNRSYEVSFRMNVQEDYPFSMNFSAADAQTFNVISNNPSTSFFTNRLFDKKGDYWIRGIIYGKDVDLTGKATGLSFDPLNSNHLKFLPSAENPQIGIAIRFKKDTANEPILSFHDFQFRLLEIPSTKVSIVSKNVVFVYGQNNSRDTKDIIEEKVLNLLPYNSNLKLL